MPALDAIGTDAVGAGAITAAIVNLTAAGTTENSTSSTGAASVVPGNATIISLSSTTSAETSTSSGGAVSVTPASARIINLVPTNSTENTTSSEGVVGVTPQVKIDTLPVITLSVLAYDQEGNPINNAEITVVLNKVDIDPVYGYIMPEEITVLADATGLATLKLWPNSRGTQESQYIVAILNPDTGSSMMVRATLPIEDCYLHNVASPP